MKSDTPELEIDQHDLRELIQKALDKPSLEITNWKAKPVHGGMELDSAVFRFQGEARDDGETIPWSIILKIVKPSEKAKDPHGIWYWKREVLAYQSGMLHRLPGGNVTAPTCFEILEQSDGSIWLWMEDVKEEADSIWPVEQYAVAARHLGQFNGAYLTGQPFPADEWVTRDWLRKYTENAAKSMVFMQNNTNHPVIRQYFPGSSLAQVLATWDHHDSILDMLDNLPQVFCHQDAFRRNLFGRSGQTIAIDWGYMGQAPVGAELVALIAGSMGFWEIPADRVREMDRLCFDAYLHGLREADWNGNPKLVRTGYALTLMLRYPIGGAVGEMIPALLNQESRKSLEATLEKPAEEIEKSDPAVVAYYQHVLPEALKLLGMGRFLNFGLRMAMYSMRKKAGMK